MFIELCKLRVENRIRNPSVYNLIPKCLLVKLLHHVLALLETTYQNFEIWFQMCRNDVSFCSIALVYGFQELTFLRQ